MAREPRRLNLDSLARGCSLGSEHRGIPFEIASRARGEAS